MNGVADYLALAQLGHRDCHAKNFRTWQMRYVKNMVLKTSQFV